MINQYLKTKSLSLSAMVFALAPLVSNAELVVITNPQMPISSISQEELNRIYLGKTKFLSNGVKVIPVDQRTGSASREKFYSDVIKKSDTEMKSYWSRVIFTGQGYPPIQESDDKSVKDLVAKNPNTMGYVDRSYVDGSVKVVFSVP